MTSLFQAAYKLDFVVVICSWLEYLDVEEAPNMKPLR